MELRPTGCGSGCAVNLGNGEAETDGSWLRCSFPVLKAGIFAEREGLDLQEEREELDGLSLLGLRLQACMEGTRRHMGREHTGRNVTHDGSSQSC